MARGSLTVAMGTFVVAQVLWCVAATAAPVTQVFSIADRNASAYCGLSGNVWEPVSKVQGSYRVVGVQIKELKRRISKASGNSKKTLQRKLSLLVALRARTLNTCRQGPPSPTPSPTLPPTIVPPSPTVSTICFVAGGDTKPGCFGIPSPLIGNENRGASLYQQQCYGCHRNKPAMPYSRVQSAFDRIPQMAPYRPTQQQLADLVAYLNRFNF